VSGSCELLAQLDEDDLVQVFERTSVAGVPKLPGYLIKIFSERQALGISIPVRDVLKRINRDLTITSLASLSDEQLVDRLENFAEASVGAPKRARKTIGVSESSTAGYDSVASSSSPVKISLLGANGEVQEGDGLNWWRNPATGGTRRNRPDEACIVIHAAQTSEMIAAFGDIGPGTIWHATAGGGEKFDLILQGAGAGGNAKQIASKTDLQLLGRWIMRDTMKLPAGTKVTAKLLRERLGTTDITLRRTGRRENGDLEVSLSFARDAGT
jgi:hypothetical protein